MTAPPRAGCHPCASARRLLPIRTPRVRGFTLLELMIVVIMIGVMVTLAIPSIARQLRDRRNNIAAHEISLLYRTARTRAIGRGSAVLVRFSKATRGRVEVIEANSGGAASANGSIVTLPATSCQLTPWSAASTDKKIRSLASFDPAELDLYSNVQLKFFDATGTGQTTAEICFSPLGRPHIRFASTGAFAPMADVPRVDVLPVDEAGRTRTVLILPDGSSRLAL